MKIQKKIAQFIFSDFTVMIIPKTTKSTKQIRLNSLAVYGFLTAFVISNIFISLASVIFYNKTQVLNSENTNLNSAIETNIMEINTLEKITVNQDQKITKLSAENEEVLEYLNTRIDEVNILRSQLFELVSTFNEETDSDIQMPISRSLERTTIKTINDAQDISNLETQKQDDLVRIIDEQRNEYSTIDAQMESKLDYLECLPDLVPIEIDKNLSSGFGYRIHPITGKNTLHKGLDITGSIGTQIRAAGAGKVIFAGWTDSYGKLVIISHGYDYESVYAHNSKLLVSKGDDIKKGDLIAELGNTGLSTGPHLHFEIHKNKKPIDPKTVLNLEN